MKVKLLSRLRLFAAPWTVGYQAPPSMGFSRQEYWSGVPFPSPRRLGIWPQISPCQKPVPITATSPAIMIQLCILVLVRLPTKCNSVWQSSWSMLPLQLNTLLIQLSSLTQILVSSIIATERLHFHFSLSCIGEGNGDPLQCSCLENPRDGGAWWAAIYAVAQSRIRLKWLSSSSSSSIVD